MTLGEMIKPLKATRSIEFRDSNGFVICHTNSDSRGVNPYKNTEVTRWYPVKANPPEELKDIDLVIYLADEDESEGK